MRDNIIFYIQSLALRPFFVIFNYMKVGSIVECINDIWEQRTLEAVPNRPFKGNAYVIRDIVEYKHGIGLHLEEIRNPDIIFPSGIIAEPSFNIERFREMTEIDDAVAELIEEVFELTEA